ncbi:hypothetical protein [Streptomyces sp. NPDC005859]|uniref:hypothetical protein n=1 Tax=Streptomyces sp. NPDC005859 TaxID=3157170 RepID=UPI0033D7C884
MKRLAPPFLEADDLHPAAKSPYATLQPLRPDEPGMTVDATTGPGAIADAAAKAVRAAG